MLGIIVVVILTIAYQAFILRRGRAETKNPSPVNIKKPELQSLPSVLSLKPFLLRSDAIDVTEKGLGDLEKAIESSDGKTFDLTRGISIHREVVSDANPLPAQESEDRSMEGVGKGHNLGLVNTVGMGRRYRERTLQLKYPSLSQSTDSLSSPGSQLYVYQPKDIDSSVIIPVFSKGSVDANGNHDAPAIHLVALPAANTQRPQPRTHRKAQSNPDAAQVQILPPGLSLAWWNNASIARNSRKNKFPSRYRRSRLTSIEEKVYGNAVVGPAQSRRVREADEGAGEDVAEYIVSSFSIVTSECSR